MTDEQLLYAAYLEKRAKVTSFRDESFAAQDAFVCDPSRFIAAQCSRRAGKTNALALKFFKTLHTHPGALCLYIALTRESARNIMWGVMQEFEEKFKLGLVFTESNLTITHPNGARLQLFGADMKNFVRRLKGIKTPGVAIDECFHPSTLVTTDRGQKRICDIVPGDYVLSALGFSKVSKVSAKKVSGYRTLVYKNRLVICSNNHPFFTKKGWVNASDLNIGDELATTDFSMRILQDAIREGESQEPQISFLQSELLREVSRKKLPIYRRKIKSQPHVQSRNSGQALKETKRDWPQACGAWWKWARPNRTRKTNLGQATGPFMELFHWFGKMAPWLSYKLQSGLGLPSDSLSHRNRWKFSQPKNKKAAGYKEGTEAGFIRLDGIAIQEPASEGETTACDFYDLTVEGHPSFTVNGVLVHNCQDFGTHLETLIEDVLTPTLTDYEDSWLALTGTPGPIPIGYFYKVTQERKFGFSLHKWTLYDNPYLPNARTFVEELKIKRGWDELNPTLRREWYNEWVLDKESLLIKYDETKNDYTQLPPAKWNYLMGVDIGVRDSDAISILAWCDSSKAIYLVEEVITSGQDITALQIQMEALLRAYDVSKIVMDTGGLGLKIAEEFTRRKGIPVHAADKKRKMENIAFLNEWLRLGLFKAKKSSTFAEDSYRVQIDWEKTTPDRIVVKDSFHSDIIDAVLYAFRESPAWTNQAAIVKPVHGSEAWAKLETDDMERAAEEHFQAQADKLKTETSWEW